MSTPPNPWLTPRAAGAAPVLAIGTMNFGKRTTAKESERIVARAFEHGNVFFDTANVYNQGESESILGRALGSESAQRSRCMIATKVGLWGAPKNAEGLKKSVVLRSLDDSLKRLGTDYVDLYYLHAPDPATPVEETLEAIKEVLDAGKARSWGVSNYASWQLLEMDSLCDEHGMPRPAVSQVIYNVLIRQIEVEYLAFARRYPIHTTVYNPLAGGLLAGKHGNAESRTGETPNPPKGSRFDGNRMYQRRYWTARFFEQVAAIALVAREEGMTPVDLAYAWLAGRTGVDSILLGPADVAQLDDAVTACAKRLSPEASAKLDEIYLAFQGTDAKYAR